VALVRRGLGRQGSRLTAAGEAFLGDTWSRGRLFHLEQGSSPRPFHSRVREPD